MPSHPLTRAQLIDQCESILQDSSNATWSAAEIGLLLDDALIEVSEATPYVMRDIYQLETRAGTATSTSSNNLVDATELQFLSTDVGKIVYNLEDHTWAVITSYSSTSQVGLSKDIFTSGEQYEIYNKGCWSSKQINIGDSDDLVRSIGNNGVISVSYPADRSFYSLEQLRNVYIRDRNVILELDVAWVDDTKETDAHKDVYVYVARQHKLNPMTDLAGEVDNGAGYAAASTTVHMDGLGATETIYKDSLFYFTQLGGQTAKSRLIYRVTEDVTLASNEGDVKCWPGLESAVVDNDDVTFIGNTLPADIERILVQIVVGEALMSKSIKNINNIVTGESVSNKQFSTGERMAEKARTRLHRKVDPNLRSSEVFAGGYN